MTTHQTIKEAQRDSRKEHSVLKANGPTTALARYKAFCSASPIAFEAKGPNLPGGGKKAVFIVDALRATATWTAIGAAKPRGIKINVKAKDGAGLPAPTLSDGVWLIAGEWNGVPIPGGVMGNSPTEVSTHRFCDRWVSFESTNGARAVEQAKNIPDSEIFIVCFQNIEAAVSAALKNGCCLFVVAAGGFYGSATLEDTVCAGRILQHLIASAAISPNDLDDEARIALATAEAFADDMKLLATLKESQVARLLREVGREDDVDAVINGMGVDEQIWVRMRSTVLRYHDYGGLGVFMPSMQVEAA
jgi:phosphosulfolactate phosphohydrolase-like enzyme